MHWPHFCERRNFLGVVRTPPMSVYLCGIVFMYCILYLPFWWVFFLLLRGVNVKCYISNYLTWTSVPILDPSSCWFKCCWTSDRTFTNFENHKLNASIIFESMFDQFNDLNELYTIQNWTKLQGVSLNRRVLPSHPTGPSKIQFTFARINFVPASRHIICGEFFMLSN